MKTAENSPTSLVAKTKKFFFGTQNRKIVTFIVLFALLAVALGFAAWNIRPLLVDDIVSEACPVDATASENQNGQFVGSDGFHRSEGTAAIYERTDGSRVLCLGDDFSVTNGPRLVVWLSHLTRLDGATGNPVGSSPENYISLGSLSGNIGSQFYEIPADVDLELYNSVVIWCEPFRVAFAIAPLEQS